MKSHHCSRNTVVPREKQCSVRCCLGENFKKSLKYLVFPSSPLIRDVWTRFCDNPKSWSPSSYSTICEVSFYFLILYFL